MSQLILESNNFTDLSLLLSLAERLDIKVVSIKETIHDERLEKMKAAAEDSLFLEDVQEVMNDFKHTDNEIE